MICVLKKALTSTSFAIITLSLGSSFGTGGCAGPSATAKPANGSKPSPTPPSPTPTPAPTPTGGDGGGSAVASVAITPNAASATTGSSLQFAATITDET